MAGGAGVVAGSLAAIDPSTLSRLAAAIPAPALREVGVGPLDIRLYALSILAGIAAATWLTAVRWRARGGDIDVVLECALYSVLAGLVGGRLYHVITSPDQLGDEWYAPFAVWEGGLGIWGAVALGVFAGALYVRARGVSVTEFMDVAAPGILLAQGIGRLGNYFNQELYGSPTGLPWGLEVDEDRRPFRYADEETFHPTFLYEMLWNFIGVGLLLWVERRFRIRPPGLFCLYVAWYSAGRLIWEQLRVDPSNEFLGQRLNFYVALVLFLGAIACFVWFQRRGEDEPSRRPRRRRAPVS
jgi:prolipoprotein diacylglyceryl transferase